MNIVNAIKDGDELVFQEVFNQYHEKLYFFIYNKTKSEYLAEEVVQTAFIKLWKYRTTLNEDFSISTQIFRIATTSLIDLIRKQQNNAAVIKEISQRTNDEDGTVHEKLDEKDLAKKISKVMDQMPTVQRRVFEMSRMEGKSYKEIAEEMSISVKTVEVHISKALKKIKSQLPLIVILLYLFKIFKGN